MEGRFGVIGVHMFLVLERIRAAGQSGDDIARALLETFMTDMDDNLREIGIGDTGVPRRVKKAAVALHEHLAGYRASMAMPADTALITALAENVYLGSGTGQPAVIARYMRRASETIGHSSWNEVCAGRFVFPAVQS